MKKRRKMEIVPVKAHVMLKAVYKAIEAFQERIEKEVINQSELTGLPIPCFKWGVYNITHESPDVKTWVVTFPINFSQSKREEIIAYASRDLALHGVRYDVCHPPQLRFMEDYLYFRSPDEDVDGCIAMYITYNQCDETEYDYRAYIAPQIEYRPNRPAIGVRA